MIEALKTQYALVKKARESVFAFIEAEVGAVLITPVQCFQNQNIRHLLVHNADCYLYWLAYMAMEGMVAWPREQDFNNMQDIRGIYNTVDEAMDAFLVTFRNSMGMQLNNSRSQADKLNATPLMIFTHVITHEFHHKGQVMAMCRQLGYPPPETDVYKCFYSPDNS